MGNLFWTLLILIILIIILFIYNLSYLWKKSDKSAAEFWQDYISKPYNYLRTGSNPINFYRKDLYRKPYEHPYKFYSSFPLPSLREYTLL
jgi:hypothetical protein